MCSRAALWSPAGKGLTSWLLFLIFDCVFVTFSCGNLGQLWYLIVSIPDFCHLSNVVCAALVADLWIIFVVYVLCLSCLLVFSVQPCGQLLGKG